MKLSREDLKSIVKEALIEILAEGLNTTVTQINESKGVIRNPVQQTQTRSNISDKINFLPRESQQAAPPARRPIADKKTLTGITSDPILQEMLADTATRGTPIIDEGHSKTQNHELMVASSGDPAARVMLKSDPTDVFGESSSKWAMLAFSEKRTSA